MKLFRLAIPVIAASIVSVVSPIAGSAQTPPEEAVSAAQPDGWEVSYGLRVGYFLPQHTNSGSQSAVRRPTYGMELTVKRKESWYGARALFERSQRWTPQQDPASEVLGNTRSPESPESRFFETVVVDAIAYSPAYEGVRGYMFSGFGSKVIGAPDETGILPYSLTAADRARTWHGGFGIQAALPGGAAILEMGDYYGRNGGDARVHDLHVTLMARTTSFGDFLTNASFLSIFWGDESDG